ncbi:MSHA biogenesis protein MshA [Janthinobacterium aquaticum]|uniref:MSHA biogenesis protein MshA n=1 Tax=Janthinobacterium sp. FT58W TaxID=2654254 RepID=UPI001264A6DA|nr:MSHA biogenesis protein MshA [Janthinobacterium sp. FT58W]KAB8044996.1 MSHA biogenesis protein MshA [Janthinobacterium sp. FT58W]
MSQQINLFNPAFEKQQQVLSAATMAQGLLLIALAGAALAWYGQRQAAKLEQAEAQSLEQLKLRQARLAKVQAEYPPRSKDASIAQSLTQAQAERLALLEAQKLLDGGDLGNTNGYSAYFRAFANGKVNGLWLTGASIVGAGTQIGLQGGALQASLVPAYISALGRQPVLRGKTFARLDIGASTPPAAPGAPTVSTVPANPAAAVAPSIPYLAFDLQSQPKTDDAAGGATP